MGYVCVVGGFGPGLCLGAVGWKREDAQGGGRADRPGRDEEEGKLEITKLACFFPSSSP